MAEIWEIASYVVTVIGLPLAIIVFVIEQRKQRQADHEEIYQRLSDEYREFLKLVLRNTDLHLLRKDARKYEFTEDQIERRQIFFEILVSLFERAYLLVYDEKMDANNRRLWQTWEDFMREWCQRNDFRSVLPDLLSGEDPEFSKHILSLSREASGQRR
jgi:hypothetical protein